MAVTTAVTGTSVILVALKEGTTPEPDAGSPIDGSVLIQLIRVTEMLVEKSYNGNTVPSLTVVSFLILTTDGIGFT